MVFNVSTLSSSYYLWFYVCFDQSFDAFKTLTVSHEMSDKLLADFLELGCKTKKEAAVAVQVYLELCEVKKCWDLHYEYNKYIECLCISGRKTKTSEKIVFVPVAATDDLSFEIMQKYLCLSQDENKSVCLAICTPDSTCVYYKISEGLIPPSSESLVKTKHISGITDGILKKHRKLLEEGAMYGLPVSLPKTLGAMKDHSDDYDP